MAIINCPKCGGRISEHAINCPHCSAGTAQSENFDRKESGSDKEIVLDSLKDGNDSAGLIPELKPKQNLVRRRIFRFGAALSIVFLFYKFFLGSTPSDCECKQLTTDGVYWSIVGSQTFEREYGYEFDKWGHIECLEVWQDYMKRQAKQNGSAISEHPEYVNASAFFEDACANRIEH